jgi:hypothetical protein
MPVQIHGGVVDRIFFDTAQRTLHLILEDLGPNPGRDVPTDHELRVSADAPFKYSVMMTKPGDQVHFTERGGHLEKWENWTFD